MCCRVATHLGVDTIIGIDVLSDRLERVRALGVDVIDRNAFDSDGEVFEVVADLTEGRGADAVIDAVGMEAHGSPATKLAHKMTAAMPRSMADPIMRRAGIDRLAALNLAICLVRRGGTVSISGVYGGARDPLPMMTLFDKQVTLRMGQANVRRWTPALMPLVMDGDPLGLETFATHRLPLADAPAAYDMFRERRDGAVKVLFSP
jgi:threonine dehydrogenase-like Zn-dependent dehydrogenase